MTRSWCFEDKKRRFFTLFPAISAFPDFQNLSDFGRLKSVLESFVSFLTKNWPKNMYHYAQTQNFQFDLPMTSWPWMTLTLNMLRESIGWYLELAQTRYMLYWIIFISYGSSGRQNQMLKIVKKFYFGLICDVISDHEVNNIRFHSTNFPDLSNAVCIL